MNESKISLLLIFGLGYKFGINTHKIMNTIADILEIKLM